MHDNLNATLSLFRWASAKKNNRLTMEMEAGFFIFKTDQKKG
jgi:hypothetical protein